VRSEARVWSRSDARVLKGRYSASLGQARDSGATPGLESSIAAGERTVSNEETSTFARNVRDFGGTSPCQCLDWIDRYDLGKFLGLCHRMTVLCCCLAGNSRADRSRLRCSLMDSNLNAESGRRRDAKEHNSAPVRFGISALRSPLLLDSS
jgi:hypothetical protein